MRPPRRRTEVVEDLRGRVERGEEDYRPGDLLPRHVDLAAHYEVSGVTIRGAIQQLVREGVLETAGRGGTRVAGGKRLFLVADSNLERLHLVDGLEAAQREAERLGGVMAELRITKDYRGK